MTSPQSKSGSSTQNSSAGPIDQPGGGNAQNGSEQADHLYAEGMAYYQKRQWRQALTAFTRLQETQPQRQGVAALIDEINWFIQLEEMAPERSSEVEDGGTTPSRLRWLPWTVSLLILIIAVVIIFVFAGDSLLSLPVRNTDPSLAELYIEGQSQLAIGNFDGAIQAFESILDVEASDIGAQALLNQARLSRDLSQRYDAAQAAIADQDWGAALTELDAIIIQNPNYKYEDSDVLRDFVIRQQELEDLLASATAAYDASNWAEAIRLFEAIRERDDAFRMDAILESLFVSYLEQGEYFVAHQGSDLNAVRQAIGYFNAALTIHPENQRAATDRRFASLYENGTRAADRSDWTAVVAALVQIYDQEPEYAGGMVACLLHRAHLAQAEKESKIGNYSVALKHVQMALAVDPLCEDGEAARNLEQAILLALATATPTSTATATATPTPLPTATATPTATVTPRPPTFTPTFTPAPPTPTPPPPPPTKTPKPPPPPTKTPKPPPTSTPYR